MIKKLYLAVICLLLSVIALCACSGSKKDSTFSIQFIDVGQGDSALVECDGHYMLIDGGDKQAGDKVYNVLEEKGIQRIDILAISHLHNDHIGGLPRALTYASSIGLTLSNSADGNSEAFRQVEQQLGINKSTITVPHVGDVYKLGSADIEVVDVSKEEDNDSLVLLITYGKTNFLFTGDIQYSAQARIAYKYQNEKDEEFKINLIKMPHHGSWENDSLNRFIRTFMPDYAVISVGANNSYGHPHKETLDLLEQAGVNVYRTDTSGDIIVKSDGKNLNFETKK